MRRDVPAHLYGRRALIDSLSAVVKRKRSARTPGRSLQTPGLQALLLGMADKIYRLWLFALPGFLRMSTEPHLIENNEP